MLIRAWSAVVIALDYRDEFARAERELVSRRVIAALVEWLVTPL